MCIRDRDSFAWKMIGVFIVVMALFAVMFTALYYHELEHEEFRANLMNVQCHELEQMILGTHETVDMHFVVDEPTINNIYMVKCNA
jgi:hypothetical protein